MKQLIVLAALAAVITIPAVARDLLTLNDAAGDIRNSRTAGPEVGMLREGVHLKEKQHSLVRQSLTKAINDDLSLVRQFAAKQ